MQTRTAQLPLGTAQITVRELTVAEIRNVLDLKPPEPAPPALQSSVYDVAGYRWHQRIAAQLLMRVWAFCGLSAPSDVAPVIDPMRWEDALVSRVLSIDGASKLHLQAMCDATDEQLFNAPPSDIGALVKKAKELNSFFFNALLPDLTGQTAPMPTPEPTPESATTITTESSLSAPFQPLFDMDILTPGATRGPSSNPPFKK
jgi:hypothetical protein